MSLPTVPILEECTSTDTITSCGDKRPAEASTSAELSEDTIQENTEKKKLKLQEPTMCESSSTSELPEEPEVQSFKAFLAEQEEKGMDCASSAPKTAVRLKNQMLQYCLEHEITNLRSMHSRPIEETADYFMHPRFNSVIGTIFGIVSGQLKRKPFQPEWRLMSEGYVPKIERFLVEEHGFQGTKSKEFARKLTRVINRRSGKRNTFWVSGISNAGKTQLMLSFVEAYFPNSYGVPNNSVRTSFTFNDCMNRRVILWEEPYINADNIEDCKLLFGGQDLRTDAKYQTGAIVESTPIIITSNHDLWKLCNGQREELSNRLYHTRLWKRVKGEQWFPFAKKDWDEFFTFHKEFIEKDCGKLGYFDHEEKNKAEQM